MSELVPSTDDRPPGAVVTAMIERVLDLAATWPAWDGKPIEIAVEGEASRVYTPHKAIRRVTDHLLDHLAELEARLAGRAPEPDAWHASAITTAADLAPFSAEDLDEARSRLRRLALIWDTRLTSVPDSELDRSTGSAWTLRQVAFHVAESDFYADSVGRLPG